MLTMNGVTFSGPVSRPAIADMPEPGSGKQNKIALPIETVVNWGVILSVISVLLFEQMQMQM